MAEQNQVQQVTMKDSKKVEQGKRLGNWNHTDKRQENVQLVEAQSESNITYYDAGAVVAIGVLGVIRYYISQSKTHKETPVHQPKEPPVHQPKEKSANKF